MIRKIDFEEDMLVELEDHARILGCSLSSIVRMRLMGLSTAPAGWSYPQPSPSLDHQMAGRSVPGFVYLFAHLEEAGLYKIGFSVNPLRRLGEVAKQEDCAAELVCTIPSADMRALERSLHEQYSLQRVRGEWFRLSEEDVAHVKSLAGSQS